MKILHGSVRSAVRVKVDDENASPENSMGYIPVTEGEHVAGHGYFQEFSDATFTVDPDGTLYLYRDRRRAAFQSFGRNAWLWVGDELDNSAFNTAHDEACPGHPDPARRTPDERTDRVGYDAADAAPSHRKFHGGEDLHGRRRFVLWRRYEDAADAPELLVDFTYSTTPDGALLISSTGSSAKEDQRLEADEWWYAVDLVTHQSATNYRNRDQTMPGYMVDLDSGCRDLPWGDVSELSF